MRPKVPHPLSFLSLCLDMGKISPYEKGLLFGGLYFCSIYLEIKVSDPHQALLLGLLKVGEFLNPSGGRGGQSIGTKQHG